MSGLLSKITVSDGRWCYSKLTNDICFHDIAMDELLDVFIQYGEPAMVDVPVRSCDFSGVSTQQANGR